MRAAASALLLAVGTLAAQEKTLYRATGMTSMNETLKAAAARIANFRIGSQNNVAHILAEPAYTETLKAQYEVTVAENSCKWTTTEPAENTFNFTKCLADQAAAVGKLGLAFRLHNLCWGVHNPSWLTSGNFSADELSDLLQKHIEAAVATAGPAAFVTDVVNEPFCSSPGQCDPSTGVFKDVDPWYPRLPDYVAQAFRLAKAAAEKHAPRLGLFVNDFSLLESDFKAGRAAEGIRTLRAQGVPIDGLGVQAHMGGASPEGSAWKARMESFKALGIRLQITEMDAFCGDPCEGDAADKQAKVFGDVLTACLATRPSVAGGPGCEAHLTWGFTDKYSWLNKPGSIKNPLPFDAEYQPKPAALEMLAVLQHAGAGIRDPTRPWAYE